MKASGTVAGLSSISGLAMAGDGTPDAGVQNNIEPAPIEVVEREMLEVGSQLSYCFVKVKNTETGETHEAAAKMEGGSIQTSEAEAGTVQTAKDIKSGTVFTKMGWDDLYDEVSSGIASAIQRATWYQTTVDDCNVYSNYTHHLLGASIEYNKKINDFSSGALGAVIGAAAGLIAGYVGSPVLQAILGVGGALVGYVVGWAVKELKDSNILTFAAIDWAVCGFGSCIPGVMVSGSGRWEDTAKDDMYQVYLDENKHLLR